ncbi:MAG: SIS domain-containing protein [Elusimicrobiota bacterium]|jgi:D-sedoheptulose 7-phosphate isomerase|nr:SIS domain-containing protein [Elusimicrobiota bacterium]
MNKETIVALIQESADVKIKMAAEAQAANIEKIANKVVEAYKKGHKTIICGNGGSASDALHFAAEMVCRFEINRPALPAITLCENISTVTAVGNDFGYSVSFSRQLEAFAQAGDVFIAISTSGNSENIVEVLKQAKKMGIFSIGMTNETGGKMADLCDLCFFAPSKITARVQECHILLIHIIAKFVETKVFEK